MKKEWIETPIGVLCVISKDDYPISISFANMEKVEKVDEKMLSKTIHQLKGYFAYESKNFDVNFDLLEGTEFQKKVWKGIAQIPFGRTKTYGEIAVQLGDINGSRAVGLATGKNPIAIMIPCHRVVGVNGSLTGYAWGIKRKKWLLEFEQSIQQGTLF